MASLSVCGVTIGGVGGVGGATYYFRGSTCYSTISALTGVTVIAKTDWGNDEPIIPVAALELSGKVVRVIAPYTTNANGTGKVRYAELVIDRGKLSAIEAKNSLKGKEYKITSTAGTSKTLGFFQSNGRIRRRITSVF
jgi:hypothetical protein